MADAVDLWDTPTGKHLRRIRPPGDDLSTAAVSPDGMLLATGHWKADGLAATPVRLWEVTTGREIRRLQASRANVARLAFTADGKGLIVACANGGVRLWDTGTGAEVRRLSHDNGQSLVFAVSPNGKLLAVAGRYGYGCIELLNLATGKEVHPWAGHLGGLSAVVFSPDGRTIATVGDGEVRLWDAATSRPLRVLRGDRAWVQLAAFSPDGKVLAAAETDAGPGYAVRLWDPATGRVLRRWRVGPGGLSPRLAFSPDGRVLAVAAVSRAPEFGRSRAEVRLYEPATGRLLRSLDGPRGDPPCLAFSPDGRVLACGGNDMRLSLWDAQTGAHLPSPERLPPGQRLYDGDDEPSGGPGIATGLVFTPDGRMLVAQESHSGICLWEVATGRLRLRHDLSLPGNAPSGSAMALSPDGRLLAMAGTDNRVNVWDLHTVRLLDRQPTEKDFARGRLRVFIRDLGRPRLLRQFEGHRAPVDGLAFSPDGRRLASASEDTTALVWDVSGLVPGPRASNRLTDTALEALWSDLAGEDAPNAYQALLKLAAAPGSSVPFIRARLRPVRRPQPGEIARLISDLDDRRFAVRQAASAALADMPDAAEPALRRALAGGPSPELRRRAEALLAKFHTPEWLRSRRALEALEYAGTADARKALETLAQGDPEAELTRQAAAATRRLAGRATPKP